MSEQKQRIKKPKKEYEVTIESTEYPSMGVGYFEGKKVLLKNTFPEQIFWGRHMKNHDGVGIVVPLEQLEKASYEVKPLCPHYYDCGGCMSQEIPYGMQSEFKEKEVLQLLKDNEIEITEYRGLITAPEQYGYRNKMEYTFGNETRDGEICLGLHHKRNRNSIITTDRCALVSDDFNKIVKRVLDYFKEKNVPLYRSLSHEGILRNLIIREGKNTGELMVILVTRDFQAFNKDEFVKLILETETEAEIKSIIYCLNNSAQNAVIPEKLETIYGNDYITEIVCELKFKITPFSFFQTNTKACEQLYETVRKIAGDIKDSTVFDLYCGTGTIGNIIAENSKKVVGIEIIEEAAMAANENSKLNNITNTEFIAGDVKDVIQTIIEKPDLIVVDPPRGGLHPKALKYMMEFGAERIIYVSCNPKTMVSDIKKMEGKYTPQELTILDNYPNTNHVETIVTLTKSTAI